MRGNQYGPQRITTTKGYSTTMALSTLNNLLVTQKLRRGDGPIQLPKSRRAERVFGSRGRSKSLSVGIKLEKLGSDYSPREDTCVRAFVRLMAVAANATPDS